MMNNITMIFWPILLTALIRFAWFWRPETWRKWMR